MKSINNNEFPNVVANRPRIAFFDYPDVFEDFYPHYGVDQQAFASTWHNTANHARLKIIQEVIGEVNWYVLSIKPQLQEGRNEYVGCRVKFLPSSWMHRQLWRLFYLPKIAWRWRKYYRRFATLASYLAVASWPLFKTLRKERPDVIVAQEYCSGRFDMLLLYARLLKIPLVAIHAGSTADKYLGKQIRRFTIPKANWIFSSGNTELNRLKNELNISSSHINIIRPPVDLETFRLLQREEACAAIGCDATKRYWLFIGRLDDSVKRVSSIISSFCSIASQYPNIDLLIVGLGKDEAKLKQQVAKSIPSRVHFLGWVAKDEEKARIYNCAECMVMASWREGFPTVIGEAFACGVPVISSDVGMISDLVVHDETGWLFPAGDDEAMSRCFFQVGANPQKTSSMRQVVRKVAEEKVSFEAMTQALKTGFSSLENIYKHV